MVDEACQVERGTYLDSTSAHATPLARVLSRAYDRPVRQGGGMGTSTLAV
jgi:hypothetical protein